MGQTTSSGTSTAQEKRSFQELECLFETRASQLLTASELAAIHRKLPDIAPDDRISPSQLASFLGLSDLSALEESSRSIEVLYRIFVRLGKLPFPDATIPPQTTEQGLTSDTGVSQEATVNETDESTKKGTDHLIKKETDHLTEKEAGDLTNDFSDAGAGKNDSKANEVKANEGDILATSTSSSPDSSLQLTPRSLLVAISAHMHRLPKIWQHSDYVGLLFWALIENTKEKITEKKEGGSQSGEAKKEAGREVGGGRTQFIVSVLQVPDSHDQDPAAEAKKIDWNSLETLPDLAAENPSVFTNKYVHAEDLRCLFTLMLVIGLLAASSHSTELAKLSSTQWRAFETAAKALVKHFSASDRISFPQFRRGMRLTSHFQNTLRNILQKQVFSETPEKYAAPKFTPSRLVTEATVAQVSVMLGSDNVAQNVAQNVAVSRENLVELYNGSKSGFSIRSLESKIFKWHAPTIFFVAGKRLKSHNKRYESFDAEFPRHFRSNESPLQAGQTQNDRLLYAVYMSEPWKISNKANFGNEDTAILALQPRADVFSSISASVHQGKSTYFNTQGMGIGFGNDQPINKNNLRRYNPGNVSLTIEANLEFAMFRHISGVSSNCPSYFHTSDSPPLEMSGSSPESGTQHPADYEDRFMITDLEVWGIGSTKELDEQKKNWEWEGKQAQARQSVNIRNMGEDRGFMEMVGLVGNHGSGGSV